MSILSESNFANLFEFRFDAECHQPMCIEAERQIARLNPRTLAAVADVSDGNHMSVAEHFTDAGVRYLKGAELSDFFVDDSAPTYVPAGVHEEMTRAQVKPGDVLVSVIGTVGPVALVTDKYDRLSCSCKLAILRPRSVNSACLAVYLTSAIGQRLIQRRTRGSVQQGIILPDLRNLPVPIFSDRLVAEVELAVGSARHAAQQAVSLYPEAEAELLDRLGWAELAKQPRELSYSANFSALAAAGRVDAESFHPSVNRVRAYLKAQKALSVDTICKFVKHGIQPPYLEHGNVGIVSQRQFSASSLDLASLENFTNEAFCEDNPDFRLRRGDVLTYCVSAGDYLGRTFFFDSDVPCVAASFVTILRTSQLVPGYLALFLNSPFGLIQSNALKRGTSPFYLYPRDLKTVLIYIPRTKSRDIDLAWQEKLAAKVAAASSAREVAKSKLAEARALVEEALSIRLHGQGFQPCDPIKSSGVCSGKLPDPPITANQQNPT